MTGNPILDSALVLGGVGLFFGFLIAMANKKFYVWEDPRIGEVEQLLPNSNCGACGQPGCRAFAEALVTGKEQPSGCTVMGEEDLSDVASFLGVDAGEVKIESSFTNDLGADSLDTVELVMALEEEFETEIPDEEAEKITTVQSAIDYINANAA